MRRLVYIVGFAAIIAVAGCGSSSSNSSSGASSSASSSAASQLSLTETEFKISPATANVASPGKVTINVKNAGGVTHAFTVVTPSGKVRTPTISPGGSATLTVDLSKPGKYVFYCPIDGHRASGMVGTLVVGSSGGAAPPASSSSSSSAGGGNGY
jgi:uncharacterized cupredoxin-like copper-binding protein